jgi:hypothetical protein
VRRAHGPLLPLQLHSLTAEHKQLLNAVVDLLGWVGAHRKPLIAIFDLVCAAVQEVEGHFSLSGPQKKSYAHDLVIAVLSDVGIELRAGWLFAFIDSMVNAAIEVAVHLFNKRGLFTHRHVSTAVSGIGTSKSV